jgi:hypothetical protein
MWNTGVKNMESWGIDPYNTGALIESFGGFVPLYKTLDYIVSYEVPGYRLASSYGSNINIKIADMIDKSNVQQFKQKFDDIIYIYPAGLYIDDRLVQGRIVLGVKASDEQYLSDILEYISQILYNRPIVIVFTTLDEGKNVSINSIGYITEDSKYVKKVHGDYKTSFDADLSRELSDTLAVWGYIPDDTSDDKPNGDDLLKSSVYLNGGYGEFSSMYTAEAGIYLTERITREKRLELVEKLMDEISRKFDNPWICVVVYYCSPGQGDLMYRETTAIAYRLPMDKSVRMVYNSSQ